MVFHGLEKMSLVDFDGKLCCTLFTGRCNYRCPFCHNGALVLDPESQPPITEKDALAFLESRIGKLDAICITGGEPTLWQDLPEFIRKVKALGYAVKLDTNGTNPEMLEFLISDGLIDYVAMDIKNSPDMYPITTGVSNPFWDKVERSARYLIEAYKSGNVDFEFRTTVIEGYHTEDDFMIIGYMLTGAPRYFLQKFENKGGCLSPLSFDMHPMPKEQVLQFADVLREYIPYVGIRGYE